MTLPMQMPLFFFYFIANLHFPPSLSFNWWHHWMNGIPLTEFFCGRLKWHVSCCLSHPHARIHGHAAAHIIFVYLIFFKCLRCRILFRQPPTDPAQGQGSSDMSSLSESIKSKWFAASAR